MFDWMNNTVLRSVSISTPCGIDISQDGSIYMYVFSNERSVALFSVFNNYNKTSCHKIIFWSRP